MIWVDHFVYMYGRWAQTHDKAAQFGICVWQVWVMYWYMCMVGMGHKYMYWDPWVWYEKGWVYVYDTDRAGNRYHYCLVWSMYIIYGS